MSKKELTNLDYQILDYIKIYIAQFGYAPSYEHIGAGVNLHSKSSVHSHIQKLLQAGEIETDHPGSPRAIRIKGAVVVMNTKDKDDKVSSRDNVREAASVQGGTEEAAAVQPERKELQTNSVSYSAEVDAHHREWLMGRFMGGTIS